MLKLPEYIDPEAWAGFLDMRRRIKKPLTERAQTMALRKLAEFRQRGFNPNLILDESTFRCWQGLYETQEQARPLRPTYRDKEGNLYEITVEGTRRYIQ